MTVLITMLLQDLTTTVIYLLNVYIPVNRTGSPQGFSLNQILQQLKTIQTMHILQTEHI